MKDYKINKLIILGIDGATWTVIRPLIAENKLPNFQKLIKNGVHGNLKSTYPPLTSPAWISLATGKNPGKLGLYGFVNRNIEKIDNDNFSGVITDSKFYKNNFSMWDVLKRNGYKSVLVNYPMLYPYYNTGGIVVGGFGVPPSADLAVPKSIIHEINLISKDYDISSDKLLKSEMSFFKNVYHFIEEQYKVVRYLYSEKKWNLFIHVMSATDWMQHFFWNDWENKKSENYKKFIDVWKLLDNKIGQIVEDNPETDIFILSDHGFGPVKNSFNLSAFLYKHGYLKKKSFSKFRKIIYSFFSYLYKSNIGRKIEKKFKISSKMIGKMQNQLNTGLPIPPEIDIEKSQIIPGHNTRYIGSVYVKNNSNDKKRIMKKFENEISEYCNKHNIQLNIFNREDIYHGRYIKLAPDLNFDLNDFNCSVETSSINGEVFRLERKEDDGVTGIHRMNGIFIAHGPNIKHIQEFKNFNIFDICPTILHMFNSPLPHDIDGNVLKEIFKDNSPFKIKEVRYKNFEKEKYKLKKLLNFKK